jgi:squalene-hopene/tetraprenyl-beta-curcumene cyclase
MARPLLKDHSSPAVTEIRRFFEDRAANWETAKPRWDTEVVATAAALAFNDKQTTGKLHPLTRKALDWMWKLQRPDGTWNWLKCNWPPMEADDYFGVMNATLGVGIAPDKYAETAAAQEGLAKIRSYLRKTTTPSLHHRTMLLWNSYLLPDLMSEGNRQATVKELLSRQREDGGWSLASLGDWKRHTGELNDKVHSPSDGYATGLAIYVLRQAGLATDDAAIQRGVAWLQKNQRESGRWFTRSVNNDKQHYITHAGTAYAVLALHSCGVTE